MSVKSCTCGPGAASVGEVPLDTVVQNFENDPVRMLVPARWPMIATSPVLSMLLVVRTVLLYMLCSSIWRMVLHS